MDNYEIVTNIGKGSSGAVFLAKNLETKKLIAIKKIEIDENRRSRCKKSVVREATILRRLNHPYIVKCKEWFLDPEEQMMHIVLEYCNGGTMQDLIRQARSKNTHFQESKVFKWMVQIVSAVAFMHSKKILHRDLKAENVFIIKPDIAKLGDFGISKEIDHTLDLAQTCVGTPCYLSPELCQDIPYSSKSDMWALGCLLFEMAALKPAFDAANLVSLFYKIVKGEFAMLPPHCSQEMRHLVETILQKDPDNRPSATKLLQHKVFAECRQDNSRENANSTIQTLPKANLQELENRNTITNDDINRTISPGPSYAYNMFLSGVKSKSTLQSKATSNESKRSISVLGKNQKACHVPKLFGYDAASPPDHESPPPQEVATARPQTCPHSASRERTVHTQEETFTDTVVTWSGYGDRGSRHQSGRRRCDSISLSSGSEDSSGSEKDVNEKQHNDSDAYSSPYESDYLDSSDEENIPDDKTGDDDIPEMIENYSGDSTHTGDEQGAGDARRVLPGSAWLRSNRTQVLQQKNTDSEKDVTTTISDSNNNNNNNSNKQNKKKARLPGSSWLSQEQRKERSKTNIESSSDDAVVLGENVHHENSSKRKDAKHRHRKSKKIRNLPGSAWLKNTSQNSNKTNETSSKDSTGLHQNLPQNQQENSMTLESCSSSSAIGYSRPEKINQQNIDPGSDSDYSYPDDFDEYEDDFELSDDDYSDTEDQTNQKSSLNVVRQGCIEILGEKVFSDLSLLFDRGLTIPEARSKICSKKVDSEAIEACYLLLQNK